MKIRNLLVMAITIALGTLCAAAQEPDGSMTFSDHLGQSITISRFGTVLSFRNRKGQTDTNNTFRICTSGSNCIESGNPPTDGTSAELKVEMPAQGVSIEKTQRLIVIAKVSGPDVTLTRKLTWLAGSSVVNVDETIAASSATAVSGSSGTTVSSSSATTVSSFRESGRWMIFADKPCPIDPGGIGRICPERMRSKWKVTSGKIVLTKQVSIDSRQPLHFRIKYDFSRWRKQHRQNQRRGALVEISVHHAFRHSKL